MNTRMAAILALCWSLSCLAQMSSAQSLRPLVLRVDTLLPAGLRSTDPACANLVVNCLTPNCRKGYMTGNNRYGLREVLMKYRFSGQGTVLASFINPGRKKMANAGTPTYAVFYRVGPEGYPDTLTRTLSRPVTMGSLRDGVYQAFRFDSALAFADSFFIGFVLPVTPGDTIGVFQTPNRSANPCAAINDTLAYQRYADGRFERTYDYYQTVFELAIKVEIEYDYVSVRKRLAGTLAVNPTPAREAVSVALPEGTKALHWRLLAPDGRVAGCGPVLHASKIQIHRGALPGGMYLIQIETEAGWLSTKVLFAD